MKPPQSYTAPFGYAVLFRSSRSGKSGKWVELGRAPTMLKALEFVNTKGKFWIHTLTAESAAGAVDGDAEREQGDEAGGDGRDDVGVHGVRPAGVKVVPVNARRGSACATIAGTT